MPKLPKSKVRCTLHDQATGANHVHIAETVDWNPEVAAVRAMQPDIRAAREASKGLTTSSAVEDAPFREVASTSSKVAESADNCDAWSVKKVLSCRGQGVRKQYKLQWEPSWVLANECDCPVLVKEFDGRLARRQQGRKRQRRHVIAKVTDLEIFESNESLIVYLCM